MTMFHHIAAAYGNPLQSAASFALVSKTNTGATTTGFSGTNDNKLLLKMVKCTDLFNSK